MATNCPNCGAPIKPGTAQCEYCGTWCKEEPKEAEPTRESTDPNYVPFLTPIGPYISSCGQVNIANGNAFISVFNGQICSTADAIRQAQNQQHDCNTAEWLRRQAEQCQNAVPYRPAPRPVCKKPERECKPFEGDKLSLATFVFLLLLSVGCFMMGVSVLFAECEGPADDIFAAKAMLFSMLMALGCLSAFGAAAIYKLDS